MTIDPKNYTVTYVQNLTDPSLIDHMTDWGISSTASLKYLMQVKLYNQEEQKHILTVGMLNEEEGYELYSSEISNCCIGERDVSFIRGLEVKPSNIHVFYNIKDFLAVVTRYPKEAFVDDAIVLHSMEFLHKVPPYLYQYNYKTLFSWMPNNPEGDLARAKLSAFCEVEPGLVHQPQNHRYQNNEFVIDYFLCKDRLAT